MEGETMADLVNEETMKARREELNTLLSDLINKIAQYERELRAITLYLDTMAGKLPTAEEQRPEHKPRRPPSGPRAPRGERRGKILDILRQKPEGYTSKEIKEIMGVTDEKDGTAINTTLHNMKRSDEIIQDPNTKHFLLRPTDTKEAEPVRAEAEQS